MARTSLSQVPQEATTGVQATSLALRAGSLIPGPQAPFLAIASTIASLLSGGLSFFHSSPELSHAQRESLELSSKISPAAQQMVTELHAAATPDALWRVLVRWDSGYVGGSSPVAIGSFIRGLTATEKELLVQRGLILLPAGTPAGTTLHDWSLSHGWSEAAWAGADVTTGNLNSYYPVLTPQGFFALVAIGKQVGVSLQAGITPALIEPFNQSITRVILERLRTILPQIQAAQPSALPSGAGGLLPLGLIGGAWYLLTQ